MIQTRSSFILDDRPLPSFSELFSEISQPSSLNQISPPSTQQPIILFEDHEIQQQQESSGKWTPEEHSLFLEGIKLFGKDWKKMVPLIKTRSLTQIRTHAQKVFKSISKTKKSHS